MTQKMSFTEVITVKQMVAAMFMPNVFSFASEHRLFAYSSIKGRATSLGIICIQSQMDKCAPQPDRSVECGVLS